MNLNVDPNDPDRLTDGTPRCLNVKREIRVGTENKLDSWRCTDPLGHKDQFHHSNSSKRRWFNEDFDQFEDVGTLW